MRFGNRKLRQQQALQYELERIKLNWTSIAKSWLIALPAARITRYHGVRLSPAVSAHGEKSSSLRRNCLRSKPFRNRLAESEASNDQAPVQMPRDYSEGASGLLRTGAKRDNLFFRAQPLRPPLLLLTII